MKRSPKEWGFTVKPGPGTRLPSGGIFPPYGHIGHWEVTGKVADELGFSAAASSILCDAAQDPDFYAFSTVEAHAQTPDKVDDPKLDIEARRKIVEQAIVDYVGWVDDQIRRCTTALDSGNERLALYWLGYALHGVEDLAVHKGITNGEHASMQNNPDFEAADVALSYVYARRLLDALRNALGQERSDRLRNHDGDGKFSYLEKWRKGIQPAGWDLDNELLAYWAAGERYKNLDQAPPPIRWDREFVLSMVLERILERRVTRIKAVRASLEPVSENPRRQFEVLNPLSPPSGVRAQWAVLVYMAGDDRNPHGIEYAIAQDLAEIKEVGSTDSVHFLVQTDDGSGTACYRYRLRKGTDVAADRLERFNGDLNTGSTKTLIDFVKWSHELFPAERTALVLWGHGSGHDDQNVYRAVRASVNPRTAARLAQRRLGFFSGTRRTILEQGPTRGYGYDDTAGDFLDNAELRKALLQVKEILGRKLDVLGFDACLMAMIEVAYQIHDVADILVASERTEPGDGWWYSRAFGTLPDYPETTPNSLVKDIVAAYRDAYRDDMTLSAVDLEKIRHLAEEISAWSKEANPADFHKVRRSALDCSPRAGDGYCDLGSFLDAASDPETKGTEHASAARMALEQAIIASCGRTSGLTIYAPGNFRPGQAGSTDSLYLGLNFVRDTNWGDFLGAVYPPLRRSAPGIESLPIPTPVTALDRHNACRVLAAVRSGAREGWLDRLREELLDDGKDMIPSIVEQLDKYDPPKDTIKSLLGETSVKFPEEDSRILILPGIMGSLLHDRSGKLGAVWVDPWNLIFGDDFDALKLKLEADASAGEMLRTAAAPIPLPDRVPDADSAVQIEPYGVIPLIYDRIALTLMHEFGPVVEYAPYDWRQPIGHLGTGLLTRIEALTSQYPAIQIALVAHSMGGLVAADALSKLEEANPSAFASVKSLIVLGTPFLGAGSALQALRAETDGLHLLKLLGRKPTAEIENTVQTFRGLFDLLPGDQKELLKPDVFAPGPLSRLLPGDAQFNSPLALVRDLSDALLKRTCAIVCTTRRTIGAVEVREDGSIDYSSAVAGDGTVSANSALNAGRLKSQSHEVDERHMTLPLDGKAIEHTIAWIGRQFGVTSTRSSSPLWPAAPEMRFPNSREELIRHLEVDDELTLGDFVALTSLI